MKISSQNLKKSICILLILIFISCNKKQEKQDAIQTKTEKPLSINDLEKETGYADVNGLKMYYEIYGTGEPIVLLHGSFMTIPLNWNKIIPELAKTRKVIAIELQGHGRTADIERPISYEGMADDVAALLDHLKIDKADILGYSMGGGVTIQTAIRHPEKVRKMVIVSGVFKYDGWVKEALDLYPLISAEMFKDSPIEKQYDSLSPTPGHFPEFVKKVMAPDLKPYNWKDDFTKTKMPAFIILGDADGVTLDHAIEMYKMKGGGKMGDMTGLQESRMAILPGSTHQGIMEKTQWLLPMVNEFLDFKPQPQPTAAQH